jgi:hypothetical protein
MSMVDAGGRGCHRTLQSPGYRRRKLHALCTDGSMAAVASRFLRRIVVAIQNGRAIHESLDFGWSCEKKVRLGAKK